MKVKSDKSHDEQSHSIILTLHIDSMDAHKPHCCCSYRGSIQKLPVHTFPSRIISLENLRKDESIFPSVIIIILILVTCSLDYT